MRNFFILVAMSLIVLTQANAKGNMKMMFQSVPMDKATLLQNNKEKMYCPMCGMTLPMFYKTNHAATHEGHTKQYCSIHCLVADKEMKKSDLKDIKVVDTNSLKFIDALTATYVVGSSKKGTMSMVSKYAFATKDEAKDFAEKNGGKVLSFDEAYKIAQKDFSQKAKQKMMAKKSMMARKGEVVYLTKCKKSDLPKFNSVAQAKAYIVQNGVCKDLNGKHLQMIGLYLLSK
jgi:nitrous oxide reductase accessory protein NosL